ncbi:DUF2971 domain-containing protein [Bacillus anthracis]|uniref:DUF2971 domain-containing protein n=1 Tax=Bacillus anthracis TaxID=1392 RepID=UPI0029781F61|nr:DUF2971 domain-containing protein [Bacillus anthracis]MCU5430723.1 DUF2971 domain-containing protein [Bacillus cereus]MEB9455945.1 DUF2971 domain-containing protein [Bacillus anthracis]
MPYTSKEWTNRMKHRTDLSGYLYHLTKPIIDNDEVQTEAIDVLLKIIKERKLLGSSTKSGFIIGKQKAICFQDTPIQGIAQNLAHEKEHRGKLGGKIRYTDVGLAFAKPYIFNQGGRPVFYEKKVIAKKILPENEWWRVVNYDLSNKDAVVDWTHEREWRLPKDELNFDLSRVIVILQDQTMYKYFIENMEKEDLEQLKGIISLHPVRF